MDLIGEEIVLLSSHFVLNRVWNGIIDLMNAACSFHEPEIILWLVLNATCKDYYIHLLELIAVMYLMKNIILRKYTICKPK